jgi:hypothetical protein
MEVEMSKSAYSWEDKYRPRKPRYFNKVHTGFEWNKYNQTHYDSDNPPPKVVQGYKFNLFCEFRLGAELFRFLEPLMTSLCTPIARRPRSH